MRTTRQAAFLRESLLGDGDYLDFALRTSASAILVFAAKVSFQFSSVTAQGR
jgi:hypothetical protein